MGFVQVENIFKVLSERVWPTDRTTLLTNFNKPVIYSKTDTFPQCCWYTNQLLLTYLEYQLMKSLPLHRPHSEPNKCSCPYLLIPPEVSSACLRYQWEIDRQMLTPRRLLSKWFLEEVSLWWDTSARLLQRQSQWFDFRLVKQLGYHLQLEPLDRAFGLKWRVSLNLQNNKFTFFVKKAAHSRTLLLHKQISCNNNTTFSPIKVYFIYKLKSNLKKRVWHKANCFGFSFFRRDFWFSLVST